MLVVHSPHRMQQTALQLKEQGKTIAFVPTMGALHRGHIDLVKRAKKAGDVVVVSIFVNPTQFGPKEDFSRYPRNLSRDKEMLKQEGVDYIFNPQPEDIYPNGYDTYVVPEKIGGILDGKFRPGHFRGVATVVLKLFNIVQPEIAIFGRKDLQQSIVIKQMVRDLNLPVKIIVAPTVRDHDRLALSSRNAYLTEADRKRALVIPEALFSAQKMISLGERSADKIRNYVRQRLVKEAKAEVDYVSVASEIDLTELKRISGNAAILTACRIGGVRLIDNLTIKVK